MSARRLAPVAPVMGLALLALPAPAPAFVPSTTSAGAPISWPERNPSYLLNERGSLDVGLADVQAAVRASYDAWLGHTCSDLELSYAGLTTREDVGFNQRGNNANVVLWQEEDWEHARGIIAVTTVTYCTEAGPGCVYNGAILDADIEMNGRDFTFTTSDRDRVRFDIANTLTHEVGHFLGLDHTPERQATMYVSAPPGETRKRVLHPDDIEGLCYLYPTGEESPFMGTRFKSTDGCAVGAPGAGGGGAAGLLLLGLGAALIRRRRPR